MPDRTFRLVWTPDLEITFNLLQNPGHGFARMVVEWLPVTSKPFLYACRVHYFRLFVPPVVGGAYLKVRPRLR